MIAFAEHGHGNADHNQQHSRYTDDGKQLFVFCVNLKSSFKVKLYQKINVFSCSHYISCTILVSRWKNTQTFFCAMENRQAEIDKI